MRVTSSTLSSYLAETARVPERPGFESRTGNTFFLIFDLIWGGGEGVGSVFVCFWGMYDIVAHFVPFLSGRVGPRVATLSGQQDVSGRQDITFDVHYLAQYCFVGPQLA